MILVLMGVAGSGKTTIGRLLAARMGWLFHDADDLHPEANRDKMRRGIALTDSNRQSWLDAVRVMIEMDLQSRRGAVVACSALKQIYRDRIVVNRDMVKIVYLKGSYELIARRLAARPGHFFNPLLLRSQFEDLEEPADAIVEDIEGEPETIISDIIRSLGVS
jgi:gluconokinase